VSDAQAMLDSCDVAGLIRHLRFNADSMELAEVARLMEGAAALSGFDDMREAAAAMSAEQPRHAAHRRIRNDGYKGCRYRYVTGSPLDGVHRIDDRGSASSTTDPAGTR
jgi:hypothetical protein